MKKRLVAVVVALIVCQPINVETNRQIHKQSESNEQEEYQEEAYPIGQQEEAYYEQTKTQPK